MHTRHLLATAILCFCPFIALASDDTYSSLLSVASQLLKDGKLIEARQTATTASSLAPDRFEGYFLAGAVAHQQGNDAEAKPLVEKALALAPAERKEKIQQFLTLLGDSHPMEASPVPKPEGSQVPSLGTEEQRRLDALLLIPQEAERAATTDERRKLLAEFLWKTDEFLRLHPQLPEIWVMRTAAAVELQNVKLAKRCGQRLQELGLSNSNEPRVRKVFAMLERQGWLVPPSPPVAKTGDWPEPDKPFENTLGMKFVPIPGTHVLFSIWDTRVQDYQTFARKNTIQWTDPEFSQGPIHPAVNVSWEDAKRFCEWLTKKEQAEGKISRDQEYRLPTDEEWTTALGLTPSDTSVSSAPATHLWGKQWPPPKGSGNFKDASFMIRYKKRADLNPSGGIKEYDDGFPETSPVGSFTCNKYGLYDMLGNVWQWCDDWHDSKHQFRVRRGTAFDTDSAEIALSCDRSFESPSRQSTSCGFRCVLSTSFISYIEGNPGVAEANLYSIFYNYLSAKIWAYRNPELVYVKFTSPTEGVLIANCFGAPLTTSKFIITDLHVRTGTLGSFRVVFPGVSIKYDVEVSPTALKMNGKNYKPRPDLKL